MEEGEGREAMAHKLLALPRPRKLTLKGYRQHWVIFKDTTLSYYKSQDEAPGDPIQQLNLKGKGIPVATALNLFPPRSWVGTIYPEEAVGGEAGFQTGGFYRATSFFLQAVKWSLMSMSLARSSASNSWYPHQRA